MPPLFIEHQLHPQKNKLQNIRNTYVGYSNLSDILPFGTYQTLKMAIISFANKTTKCQVLTK